MSIQRLRYSDDINVRCHEALPRAIALAANRALTSSSEYIRRAIIERLRADGIDIAGLAGQVEPADRALIHAGERAA